MNRLPKAPENDIGLNYTPLLMQQPLSPEFVRQRRVHENSPDFDGASQMRQIRSLPIDPELLACFKMPITFQHKRNEKNDNSGKEYSEHCHKQQDEEEIYTDDSSVSGTNKPIFNCHNASYNGNYEGDVSMFANQQKKSPNSFNTRRSYQRRHYQQDNHEHNQDSTDSDHDVCRNFSTVVITEMTREQSPILASLQRAADIIFTQNQQNQLKIIFNWIYESIVFQLILLVLTKFGIFLAFAFLSLWKVTVILSKVIEKLHIKRNIRSHAKKTLWFVTLLKRNDTLLFGALLISTPWLFFLGAIGFTLSFYSDIKRLLIVSVHLIKNRLQAI